MRLHIPLVAFAKSAQCPVRKFIAGPAGDSFSSMADIDQQVAEMPGLYGPFTLAERVIQKIWLRGDFEHTRAVLTDGRPLEVRATGRWNLLGGPDFKDAHLRIAGQECRGDIEVHFHARDWRAHGHAQDAAYAQVVLHVVLFPPAPGEALARRRDGKEIPTFVLLPCLHRGLEEYGSDDALESLTERDEWQHYAELAVLTPAELRGMLVARAQARWRQKVHFARVRLQRLGWEAALHHTALEILGYRQNRAPMLTVAGRYPLASWRNGLDLAVIEAEEGLMWQRSGVRPANLPRVRLAQYQRWVTACPDWPDRVARWQDHLPGGSFDETQSTQWFRQQWDLPLWREKMSQTVVADAVGGTRLDNLIADGFLPLLAARGEEGFALWFHWPLGDMPPEVRRVLRKLGVVTRGGHWHCQGWGQGMLGWFLARAVGASS